MTGMTASMTGILLTRRKLRQTLDTGALDTGVLRKENYSLFLEYTIDMNNC